MEFFNEAYYRQVLELAQAYPDSRSLYVGFSDLSKFDYRLADALVERPDTYIKAAEAAARELKVPTVGESSFSPHVRIVGLAEAGVSPLTVQNLGAEHLNKLVSLEGVVTLITQIMPKLSTARWVCIHCTRSIDTVIGKTGIDKPTVCPGCGRGDGLFLSEQTSGFVNMQRSQVQDPVEKIRGNIPAPQVDLWLEDDLTNTISPGENLEVTGILRLRQNPQSKGKSPVYSKFFDVVSIQKQQREFEELTVTKEEEAEIVELSKDPLLFDKVVMSIAPSIYGYSEMKEAIALQLFGGTPFKVMPDGKKIRSDLHILLVGDPGTAKSAILQYVKDLAPKAIYVSGRGASGVGLTASAEKDEVADGGWVLKAGALVLASGGVVMVDEFDKMEPNDRASMHEAMEQQSYHPKTRILLADGSEREIGALVDGLIKDRRNQVIEGKDCEILSLAPGELDIFTSDFHSVCKTGVDRVSRHKAPEKFISITLRNGRNVLVTPEHPCWVIEDGRITTKPAEKVTEEDFLPVPAVIPVGGEQQRLENKVFDARKKMTVVVTRFPAHNDADFCKFVGYLITDGGYELNRGRKVGLNFTNKDDELVADFCSLSNKLFGLDPYVRRRNNGVKMARIVSKPLLNYLCQLDACFGEKSDRKRVPPALMKSPTADILPMLSAMFECDGWATRNRVGFISPNKEACEQVQTLLLRFGITSTLIEQTTSSGKKIWKVDVTGAENLRKFSGEIGFLSERKNDKLAEQIGYANFRTVIDVVPNIGRSLSRLCHMLKVDESKVLGYSLTPFKTGEQNVSKRALGKFAEAFEEKLAEFAKARDEVFTAGTPGELRQIRRRLNASLQDIEGYACSSHQNLSLAERGKGDIELLQKGLLGLADKALETGPEVVFLKRLATGDIAWSRVKKAEAISNGGVEWVYDVTVEPTRSFISECMLLHNTISIAKAGIVTTFKAKTSVLAASNPKLGRFDPNVPPAQQFDIPPTLMSRFDLIFTIKDVLDEARDRKLVDHVLTGHIMAAKKVKLEDLKGSPIVPPIYPEKLRKYIAYARRFVRPILSDEAASRIKDYYLGLRRLGAQQNTYPVTAREIEGLIRLSEASAKVRLSPTVDLQDSERAINLVHFVLSDIFMDKETGRIDSDIINTGQPKSKVDKLRAILGIISALEKKFDLVDIDAIVAEAQGVGFDEAYARRLVDELKRQGDLYEPKVGYVKSSRSKEL